MDQTSHQNEGAKASEDQGESGAIGPTTNRAAKTNRAKGQKSKSATARRSIKLSLPVEVIGKLQLHAIQEGVSVSGLVARLTREHCNEWVVHKAPTR